MRRNGNGASYLHHFPDATTLTRSKLQQTRQSATKQRQICVEPANWSVPLLYQQSQESQSILSRCFFLSSFLMIVNTLFVGDLPQFCTECELAHLFSSFGPLVDVKIKRSINNGRALTYGFVTLSSFQGAEAARIRLDGYVFMGRKLR